MVKSGQAVATRFTLHSATGAAANADILPTATLIVNGASSGAVVTVSNASTGAYSASVTLPSLSAGDIVEIEVQATISAIACKGVVWSEVADTRRVSDSVAQTGDSFARIGANGAGLTSVGDTSGTTTLLSRLSATRAGYLDNLSAGAVALASALSSAASDITTLLSRLTSTRAGYLDNLSAAPPTAGAIADAVWDEALSGHATAGTAGHYLTDAGSGADPMENAASGYASGTLGAIISRLISARVTVSSFLSEAGDMLEVVAGADYNATDATSFDWTQDTGAWPDLTSATVVWHGRSRTGTAQTYSMSVTDATGATKAVRLELTSAQTTALAAVATGVWTFAVWATLSSGRKARLVKGTATVVDGPGPS